MNNSHTKALAIRGVLLTACVTALGMPATIVGSHAALDRLNPPRVPAGLEVEAGNEPFLVGHADGTQNYICLPSASAAGFTWTLFTPQATLFNERGRQLVTHYFSPNPEEGVVVRAAWQDRDTSIVWGRVSQPSSDPQFVRPGAIPWLLIETAGTQEGPTGGDNLTRTTFIQRVNTVGGVAPSTGCAATSDVGRQAFVPYTADYFFYEKARHGGGN